jgi:hypothetical protein
MAKLKSKKMKKYTFCEEKSLVGSTLLSPDSTFRVKRRDFLVVQNFFGFCLYMFKEK